MKSKTVNGKIDVNSSSSSSSCPVCKNPGEKLCQGCFTISYCSVQHQKEHWTTHKPNCCPYILKETEDLGRHLIAARKLRPGLFLIEENPLIFGPRVETEDNDENSKDTLIQGSRAICLTCCKKINSTILNANVLCSKCKWPVCGAKCSKAKQHAENECTHFVKNKIKYNPSILPPKILYRGIMLLRSLLTKIRNNNPTWNTINYLQHERGDKSKAFDLSPEIISRLRIYFKISQQAASDEELNRLNNIIEINAFSIERVEEENENAAHATVLFHKSSLLTHSCIPNCTWSISYSPTFSMRVRTSREIKKGEILTISYNQPWNYYGIDRRRHLIASTAGFNCKCERCTDPTELGTFASGIKCKAANCSNTSGYLLPGADSEDVWKCNECQNSLPSNLANAKINSLENELSELQTIYMTVPMAGMKVFEDFIETNRDKVLHKNHWILQQARRIIVNIHGAQLRCLQWDQLENFISHCSNLLVIWDVLAPGISLERAYHQMQLSRALTLQFDIKSEKLSEMSTDEKFIYLKKIHELQNKALMYWKQDIQTKPLGEEMGYEANNLQLEITNTLTKIANLHGSL